MDRAGSREIGRATRDEEGVMTVGVSLSLRTAMADFDFSSNEALVVLDEEDDDGGEVESERGDGGGEVECKLSEDWEAVDAKKA